MRSLHLPLAFLPAFTIAALLSGPAWAQLSVDPTSIDFGGERLGESITRSVTLSNTGGGSINITDIAVTSGNLDFAVSPALVNMLPLTLLGGSSLPVEIIFTPVTNTGARSGSIRITASSGGPLMVSVTGTGGDPVITLGNNAVIFGSVHVGSLSAVQKLTLDNDGFSPLELTSVTLGGSDPADFLLTLPALPATVLPGDTFSYDVAFRPMAASMGRSATVTVVSNDPKNGAASFSLGGSGVPFAQAVSPKTVDFGSVKVGASSAVRTVALTNSSQAALVVDSAKITGPQASAFTIVSPAQGTFPATVAAGGRLDLSVRFDPTSSSAAAATLSIGLPDPNLPSAAVTLRGTGTVGAILVTPGSIDLGRVAIGQTSASRQVSVRNGGKASFQLTSLRFSGPDASAFSVASAPSLPVAINPGASRTLNVRFTPRSRGSARATFLIGSDDPATPSVTVLATARGTQGRLDVSRNAIDFGVTAIDAPTEAVDITLSNLGDDSLRVTSIAITGADDAQFQLIGAMVPKTLMPGEDASFSVRFNPDTAISNADANVVIRADGLTQESVSLTGTASATILQVMPAELDFAIIGVGLVSDPATVTIKSLAPGPITLAPPRVTTANFGVITDLMKFTLDPNETTSFQVTFNPQEVGEVLEAQAEVTLAGAPMQTLGSITLFGSAILSAGGAGGSGGCSVAQHHGHPGGTAALGLLLLLGVLALRRRS